MLPRHLKQQTEQFLKRMVKSLELHMQRVFMVLELVLQHPLSLATLLLPQLKQQDFLNRYLNNTLMGNESSQKWFISHVKYTDLPCKFCCLWSSLSGSS